MRGTRAQAERAFDVRIADYRIDGRTFRANESDPALPLQLASRVQSIAGLSNLAIPSRAAPDSGLASLSIGSAPDCGGHSGDSFPVHSDPTPLPRSASWKLLCLRYAWMRLRFSRQHASVFWSRRAKPTGFRSLAALVRLLLFGHRMRGCADFFNATGGAARIGDSAAELHLPRPATRIWARTRRKSACSSSIRSTPAT